MWALGSPPLPPCAIHIGNSSLLYCSDLVRTCKHLSALPGLQYVDKEFETGALKVSPGHDIKICSTVHCSTVQYRTILI